MEALRFLHQILKLDANIYPVLMWIQIHARGGPDFFLLKWCNLAHSECSQIRYYLPKNKQFQGKFSIIVKIICHISHQYQSRLACQHKSNTLAGSGEDFFLKVKENEWLFLKVIFFTFCKAP